jgi:hypothetical protein
MERYRQMNSKFADKAAFISSSRKCAAAAAFFLALVSELQRKKLLPAVEKFFCKYLPCRVQLKLWPLY